MVFIVGSIFFIEEESKILDLLSEGVDRHDVLVMSVVIVIILHKLFVLDMSVFLLDGIELISESEVVLVSLLDFKDLSLQLRDQKVLLVTSQMHGVVVLIKKKVSKSRN